MEADNRECDAAYEEMVNDPSQRAKFWLTRKEIVTFTVCIVGVSLVASVNATGILGLLAIYFISYVLRLNSAIEKRAAERKSKARRD